MHQHHIVERIEHDFGPIAGEALCFEVIEQLDLTDDNLPEPNNVPIHFFELLLTHPEPLFLDKEEVQ